MTAREAAFLSLQKFERDGKYSNIELSASIEKYNLSGVEKAFYTALLYGVIERKITLDYMIPFFSQRALSDIDRNVKTAIYLGLYQLYFMDKVPDSAAVNESVSLLTRFYAKNNSEGFANAVLRAAARDRNKIVYPDKKTDLIKYLSVTYSVPEWICGKWVKQLGEKTAEESLSCMLSHPHLTLCVNTLKITRDEFISLLSKEEIKCEKTALSPRGVRMTENVPYDRLVKFENLFFVQDEASQLCGEVLGMEDGETLLDACACPGGKSFYSAIRAENKGEIISCDLHKNKLSLIASGAERLGIDIISVKEQNGTEFCEEFPLFDKVLCDVPCSGLGVMAKKPEIRYKSEEETLKLPAVQLAILKNCAGYVKDGGTLVYSTCTLSREENEDVVQSFLSENSSFSPQPFEVGALKSDGICRILPQTFGTDGFFIAKLVKREKT